MLPIFLLIGTQFVIILDEGDVALPPIEETTVVVDGNSTIYMTDGQFAKTNKAQCTNKISATL